MATQEETAGLMPAAAPVAVASAVPVSAAAISLDGLGAAAPVAVATATPFFAHPTDKVLCVAGITAVRLASLRVALP